MTGIRRTAGIGIGSMGALVALGVTGVQARQEKPALATAITPQQAIVL